MRLEHVNLTVADVDRSAAFYSDLLGLRIRWKGTIEGGRAAVHVGDDDFYLALFEGTVEGVAPNDYASPGINHVGFVVDDLDAARERLLEMGARRVTEVMDYEPGRRLYFDDLDGVEVELVEY